MNSRQLCYRCQMIAGFLLIVLQLFSCNENDSSENENIRKGPILNADFEQEVLFAEDANGWNKWSWKDDLASYTWCRQIGKDESNCICLSSETTKNDIVLFQEIQLESDKVYELSSWVRTENVFDGRGANICLYGTYLSSEPIIGTHDWQKTNLVFLTTESGKVSVGCRLGFWGGAASGKAWFDNLEVQEVNMFCQQSKHIRLIIKPDDASVVDQATIVQWLEKLDRAYEKYYELVGQYPYEGKIITVFSSDTYPGGWAVAGNPILWHQPYVTPTLLDIKNRGDWSFGILHEIAHDFAPDIGVSANSNWNWNEEMFANFRMYYAVDLLDASVLQDKLYTGDNLKFYYKTYARDSYDKLMNDTNNRSPHDGIMYTLIRIKDEIGWEPFKQTFRYLYQNNTNLSGSWNKFNFFLDKLSEYSEQNVRNIYPDGELEKIQILLNN